MPKRKPKRAQRFLESALGALGFGAGDNLPISTKGHWLGVLHALGGTIVALMRLGGFANRSVCFEPVINRPVVPFDNIDPLIVSAGGKAETELEASFVGYGGKVRSIGDCLGPRPVEKAILESLRAGSAI